MKLNSAFAAVWICLAVLVPTHVLAVDLSTPESTVEAYIAAVASRDFNAVLATTATDQAAENFNFVAMVERLGVLTAFIGAPSTDPFFVAINRGKSVGQISQQLQMFIYGLMTTNGVAEGQTVKMDAGEAQDFVDVLRLERLNGLKLEKVAIPDPSTMNGERYQLLMTKMAKPYGGDAATERVALVSFEGLDFLIGFTLIEFKGEWRVLRQDSGLSGLGSLGAPKRLTREEFDQFMNK